MKKIIFNTYQNEAVALLSDIPDHAPIFAKKKNDKLAGMVVREHDRWILRIGGQTASNGWHDSRIECLQSNLKYGYEFFVE